MFREFGETDDSSLMNGDSVPIYLQIKQLTSNNYNYQMKRKKKKLEKKNNSSIKNII